MMQGVQLHILIIEDNPGDFYLVESYLLEKFNEVVIYHAHSLSEARSLFSTSVRLNIILLDLTLPDAAGTELIMEILNDFSSIPVIALTGRTDDQFGLDSIKLGITDYVEKHDLNANILYKTILYSLERKTASVRLKHAYELLKYTEEKFRTVLTHISEVILTIDEKNIIQFVNNTDGIFKGFHSPVGHSIFKYLPSEYHITLNNILNEVRDNGYIRNFEICINHPAGNQSCYSMNVGVFTDRSVFAGFVISSRDITEKKMAQANILKLNQQLREFSTRLSEAIEDERKKISREIHDELGQQLSGLKIEFVRLMRKYISPESSDYAHFNDVLELVKIALNTVRRIATDLRPGMLDDLGLESALEWLINDFKEKNSVACQSKIVIGDEPVPDQVSNTFFRVLQEALNNIHKHAEATKLSILFYTKDKNYILEITDNGKGIMMDKLPENKGLGIIGMKERALSHGGDFSILSPNKGGTQIILKIPKQNECINN